MTLRPVLTATALAASTLTLLPACSSETPSNQTAAAPAKSTEAPRLDAPTGSYRLDPTHASLHFTVKHLGLAPYMMRFTDFEAELVVADPVSDSSIELDIDPTSIRTDYPGDYKATHKKSPFDSWDQDLAMSSKFLDAGNHPELGFESTTISLSGPNELSVDGELTMRGQTHPVSLKVKLTGMVEEHPFAGVPAVGFDAHGEFQRSEFGMTHLTQPEIVSDMVHVHFLGEFHQTAAAD
nr:YceI family protein [Oceanococcus sp. HetDA_MAG_MS8]